MTVSSVIATSTIQGTYESLEISGCDKLRQIGPDTRARYIRLPPSQYLLIGGLGIEPAILSITNGDEEPETILAPHTYYLVAQLLTKKIEELLPQYQELVETCGNPQRLDYLSPLKELLPQIETRLKELAQAKIRAAMQTTKSPHPQR